jgi:glycerol uptake facilitator-like aquaporin
MSQDTKQYLAEFVGTFIFVLLIISVISKANPNDKTGGTCENFLLPVLVGAGLTIAIYVSQSLGGNGHLNPAVSLSMTAAGKLESKHLLPHIIAQALGAIVAYYVHSTIVKQ